ncbi:GntR family transcriptional regulator [Clostridium nigeriense]|uniref:GntR family transcriptional regulator n=1 Tax=Clostridium nigeriense TaxID=1805470 RepID=UPI00082FFF14|nr:GntR family transcriptional regulator [Clostridium nigeriense]
MLKYVEISNDIRNKIIDGIYLPNEKLPYEKDICDEYNSSKMTVKKALDILVAEGLLVKRRGSGTFVKDINPKERDNLIASTQFRGLSSFYANHKVESIILTYKVINPDKNISKKLLVNEEDFVYQIIRVRSVDGVYAVIEEMYMPIQIIPGLKKKHLYGSIYEYIERILKLKIQSAHRTITVKKATDYEIKHLNVKENDPLGIIEQVAYLDNGQAFEYSIVTHRCEEFKVNTVVFR